MSGFRDDSEPTWDKALADWEAGTPAELVRRGGVLFDDTAVTITPPPGAALVTVAFLDDDCHEIDRATVLDGETRVVAKHGSYFTVTLEP